LSTKQSREIARSHEHNDVITIDCDADITLINPFSVLVCDETEVEENTDIGGNLNTTNGGTIAIEKPSSGVNTILERNRKQSIVPNHNTNVVSSGTLSGKSPIVPFVLEQTRKSDLNKGVHDNSDKEGSSSMNFDV